MSAAAFMGLCVLGCLGMVAAPLPSSEMIDPDSNRARSHRRSEARLAATIFVIALLAFGVLLALGRGASWPIVPLVVLTAVGLVALHPWLAVRWVCIPLGLPRLALKLGRLGGHPWVRDPEGGQVLAAVLAQLRRPVDDDMHQWLRGQLQRGPLRGAGLVAAGLLAADAGDRAKARALLVSLDDLDPDLCPPLARKIALDWLVADAVRNGDWARVSTLADDHPSPSRTVRLMALLARVHRGETHASVGWAWMLAPRRRHTLALVRGVLAPAEGPVLEPVAPVDDPRLAANDGGPSPAEALALHVEALGDTDAPGPSGRLTRLGHAWDRAMDDFGFRGRVRRRAQKLRCTVSGELVMARLHREACEDLARALLHSKASVDSLGEGRSIERAVAQMHTMALDELEEASAVLAAPRPSFASVDDVISSWLTWLSVRRRYQALAQVTAPELRKQAYVVLELNARQLMAWMWNEQRERGLANAIATWLMLEAERVHDEESAAYHRHNVSLVI
ncbi:MAG: hypothetical protein AAF799_29265 [Myxococcota bacterium]